MKKITFFSLLFLLVAGSKVSFAQEIVPKDNEDEALFSIYENGKVGFIDKTGRVVVVPQFDESYRMSEGVIPVLVDGRYGYINSRGEVVALPEYDDFSIFSEGMAAVKIGDKWGYIDKNGRLQIAAQFKMAGNFSEGLANVNINGLYGFIDKTGRFVIEPIYREAHSFSDGLALVRPQSSFRGFINMKGEELIAASPLRSYLRFSEGLCRFSEGSYESLKYGYMDKKGDEVIGLRFDDAGYFHDGLAYAKIGDIEGYIDVKGEWAFISQYDEIKHYYTENRVAVRNGDKCQRQGD